MDEVLCLALAGVENNNANNIIFTIKDTKLLAKSLKDQCTGMNIKQKVRIKIREMNIGIFSKQIL